MNRTHHVHKDSFDEHVANCRDQDVLYRAAFGGEAPAAQGCSEIGRPEARPVDASVGGNSSWGYQAEENWDYAPCSSYDVAKAILGKPVLRNPQGLTKSERKVFREQERIRLRGLMTDKTTTGENK